MTDKFPFSYFSTWINPQKMFTNRKKLSWGQMILTLVFSFALILLTVPVYYARQSSVNLGMFMPKVNRMLKNQDLQKTIHQTLYHDGTFDFKGEKVIENSSNGIIGINIPSNLEKNYRNGIFLSDQEVVLKENGTTSTIRFMKDINPSKGNFYSKISQTWFRINRMGVTFSTMYMLGAIVLFTNLIFLFIGAFFLWLTRKSSFTTIATFKEACAIFDYVIGPSCFITAIIGFFKFDISMIMMVETLMAVVYLLMIYGKTHFNDEYVANQFMIQE